jgi:hypothetical protein
MSALSTRPPLADLAAAVLEADTAWDIADKFGTTEMFDAADTALIEARAAFAGALIADTGISKEMFDRLGFVL